ncbi:MAG: isoprenylcysteine carboxylmethyltransferase family protein [Dehalococcoidales bacterium]|nr:isoprenylcysteine carboxylmethyltransferase family protein [Dehalococcoidales bacterium]
MNQDLSLLRRIFTSYLAAFIILALLLFFPAGTWRWPEGWLLILVIFTCSGLSTVWLWKCCQPLLNKRLGKYTPPAWDRVIMLTFTILFLSIFVIAGLDAVRFGWSHVPVFIEVPGFAGLVLGMYFTFLTMKENPFASPAVEIQAGQKVISTGPYRIVRHPMYASAIIMSYSISLALGSLYSLIPDTLLVIGLVWRTILEERLLRAELEGYTEYAQKVKFRLVPGIW